MKIENRDKLGFLHLVGFALKGAVIVRFLVQSFIEFSFFLAEYFSLIRTF